MYYATVNWYDDYNEEDKINHMLIPANDWNEAMQKVTNEFQWINSIEMKEIIGSGKVDIVYIPEDCVEAIMDENNY